MNIEETKKKFPIGQKVKYFPVKCIDRFSEHEIRSEPWALGHGDIVIKVTGKTGGLSIDHLVLIS